MRKQCCSNLRQGSLFQATLISSVSCLDDVFLFAILLISLSSIQQVLRQPIPSITEGHSTMTARFRLLLPRTCSFLASHPASWIEVQSLPRGCHFLVPIHQMRTCTSYQQISCVAVPLQPAHPHAFACFGLTDRTSQMMLETIREYGL